MIMTGEELTSRLINDLEEVVRAKSIARSQEQIMADIAFYASNPSTESNFNIGESWIALTCDISLPGELARFTQLINLNEKIISYNKDDKVDISYYLNQIMENKNKIAVMIEQIKDNNNHRFVTGQNSQPLFDLIKERADYIHSEAISVDNCYIKLKNSRKE